MPVSESRTSMPVSARQVEAWLSRAGAEDRLSPPWRRAGSWDPWSLVPLTRVTEVTDGPDGRSELIERIEATLPLGGAGERLLGPATLRHAARLLRHRGSVMASDLARLAPGLDKQPLRVAITGASGMVGRQLAAFLTAGGHEVIRLVRDRTPRPGEVAWNPATGRIDHEGLEGLDAVVHLAGENLGASRWSPERKRAIRESRVVGTKLIAEAISVLRNPPKAFLSASAIGYYGDRGTDRLEEDAGPGTGFLAEVARAWEVATAPAFTSGIRTVTMRFGVVLTWRGGALARMKLPFLLGAGGPVGTGRQGLSWIALDDLIYAIHHLIRRPEIHGAVNVVAPEPVSQAEFAKDLGRALHRPAVVPLPAGAVRTIFGEMGEEMLLSGQFVVPARLERSGFTWSAPRMGDALTG